MADIEVTDESGREWEVFHAPELSSTEYAVGISALYLPGRSLPGVDHTEEAFIGCTASEDFCFGTGDFTIEMWLRSDTLSRELYPIMAGNYVDGVYGPGADGLSPGENATDGFHLKLWASDEYFLKFYAYVGGARVLDLGGEDTNDYISSDWLHLAIERVGNVFTLYVDGKVYATETVAITMPTVTGMVFIGRSNWG